MTMESDTYDSYLKKELPDARDLCGEPEYFTPGLLDWDSWVLDPEGAVDGKVCTEARRSRACSRGRVGDTAAATTSPPPPTLPPIQTGRPTTAAWRCSG